MTVPPRLLFRLAAGGLAAFLLAWAFWLRSELIETREKLSAARTLAAENAASAAALEKELAARDALIVERDTELERIRQSTEKLKQNLKKVSHEDPQTAGWARTPVPAAVSRVLAAPSGGADSAPDASPGADAGRARTRVDGRE